MNETDERAAVVREALSWVGTPYHHQARVKRAGVDCGQILAAVYEAAGLIPHVDPGDYPSDWHLHREGERYLEVVQMHAREIDGPPSPGDIAVWRFGCTFSHGAIVIDWPEIVHSYVNVGVTKDNALENSALSSRPVRFFSPWGDK